VAASFAEQPVAATPVTATSMDAAISGSDAMASKEMAAPAQPTVYHRRNISGGSEWEPRVGYSRVVRVGGAGTHVFVSGTTASSEGAPIAGLGAEAQARATLQIILRALAAAGARAEHVVRTRMFVVDIAANGAAVGRAHGEVFGAVRPAASMLGVAALIDPLMIVEIEADAIVPDKE
jgi:enamine deaminase RidA (YjgF/YER057c/UK114 family)